MGAELASVAELCNDRPSRAAELRGQLEQANATLRRATRVGPLLSFARWPPQAPRWLRTGLTLTATHVGALTGWVPAPPTAAPAAPAAPWALKWQASKDGFDAAAFHRLCDGVPRLLVLVQSSAGFVFGGYTAAGFCGRPGHAHRFEKQHSAAALGSGLDFGNSHTTADADAFLFTLTNPHGRAPTKFNVAVPGHALLNDCERGPTFGNGDLFISSHSDINSHSSSALGVSYNSKLGLGGCTFTGSESWVCTEILAFAV